MDLPTRIMTVTNQRVFMTFALMMMVGMAVHVVIIVIVIVIVMVMVMVVVVVPIVVVMAVVIRSPRALTAKPAQPGRRSQSANKQGRTNNQDNSSGNKAEYG